MYLLKNELERVGHQVDILAHHPDMQQIYLQSRDTQLNGKSVKKSKIKDGLFNEMNGYYLKNLPHVEPWIRWREIERYTFELCAALFDLKQYDIIHTQDIVATRALRRVKPAHIPLVYTLQGLVANVHLFAGDITSKDSLSWKYVCAEEYYGTVSADKVIATSDWLRRELSLSFGVPHQKMEAVIPYGMDAAAFLERMKEDPDPPVHKAPGQLVIACPARLSAEKGHRTLIDAIGILKQHRNDFTCWIIGDGVLRSELEKYCVEKGVADCIDFMGNRSDVPALLHKADVMVLASIEDNFPHAVMEAQIAGKAVVASNGGGIPEMIEHGKTGLIFEKSSATQLAHHLNLLFSDSELRRQLGNNAKIFGAKQWSSKLLCERTLDVYERVITSADIRGRIPMEQPELDGKYGLIRDKRAASNAASGILKFETDSVFYTKEWRTVIRCLPDSYSIPDTAFIKVLAKPQ